MGLLQGNNKPSEGSRLHMSEQWEHSSTCSLAPVMWKAVLPTGQGVFQPQLWFVFSLRLCCSGCTSACFNQFPRKYFHLKIYTGLRNVSFCRWSSVMSLQWNPAGRWDLSSHGSALINFSLGLVEYPQTCIASWFCGQTTCTSLIQSWLKSHGWGWHLWTAELEDVASQERVRRQKYHFLPGPWNVF